MKRQGDEYYANGDYRSALFAYKQGGLENTKDNELQLKIGVCLYENNDVDGALHIFQSLINEGKTCLLYTSPSPRDRTRYRMPSFA